MASSSILITYVESGYVDDQYVVQTQELTICLDAQSASASGVAEVVRAGSGALETGASTADGVSERTVVATGDEQVDSSVVNGDAGRSVNGTSTLESGNSTASSVAERIVTSTGELTTGESSVIGTTSRTINSIEADLTAEEVGVVVVAGDAERKVITQVSAIVVDSNSEVDVTVDRTVVGIEGQPTAQEASLTGIAERIITGAGTLVDGVSEISGSGGRSVLGDAALVDGISTIAGVAEREITSTGVLVGDTSTVAGVAEREITSAGVLVDGQSTASGVAEREVDTNETDQSLNTGDATIAGVGERIVTATGDLDNEVSEVVGSAGRTVVGAGTLEDASSTTVGQAEREVEDTTGNAQAELSEISGVAERTVNGIGDIQTTSDVDGVAERTVTGTSVLVDDVSTVTGDAERTIVANGDEQTDTSEISGVAERIVNSAGQTQTDTSEVSGVAERTIVTESGIEQGDTSEVVGQAGRTVVAVEADLTADEVGVVVVAGDAERMVVTLVAGMDPTDHNLIDGSGVRTANSLQGTPQAQPSTTTGVAERIIVSEETTLDTQVSVVDGEAERVVTASGVLEVTDLSDVDGVAERIIVSDTTVESGASSTTGLVERIIVSEFGDVSVADDSEIVTQANIGRVTSPELTTVPSTLDGLAERIIVDVETPVQAQVSEVEGDAQRKINAAGSVLTDSSVAVGEAERIIDDEGQLDLSVNSDPSTLSGLAERIIVLEEGIADTVTNSVTTGQAFKKTTAKLNPDVGNLGVGNESTVDATVDRIVVLQSGIAATLNTPQSSSNISFAGDSIVLSNLSEGNGTYDLVRDVEFIVDYDVSPIVYISGDGYSVWQKQEGSRYDIIVWAQFTGGTSRWLLLTEGFNDAANITSGQGVSGFPTTLTFASSTITSTTTDAFIDGVAERIVTGSGVLETDESLAKGNRHYYADGPLQTTTTVVAGVAEREVETNDTVQALNTGESTSSGVAERTVVLESGFEQADNSTVVVDANQTRVTSPAILSQTSEISGVAERTIVQVGSDLNSTDASVSALAEREIKGQGTLGTATETVSYTVTNSGAGAYLINGVANAPLEFKRGSTYILTIVANGHPFWINTVNSTGTSNAYSDGVTNNGTQNGVITFVVPNDAPDDLFYNCQYHSSMNGSISVSNASENSSSVNGLSERELTSSADLQDTESDIVGVAERIITAAGDIQVQEVDVVAVVERTVNSIEADITADEVGVIVVAGDAERMVVTLVAGMVPTDHNLIDGTAERTVNSVSTNVEAQASDISGVAERILTGSGDAVTGSSDLSGVAERVITQVGSADLKPINNNSVSGDAERVITTQVSIAAEDAEIVGETERVVSGDLSVTAPDAVVSGVAERTVVQVGSDNLASDDATISSVSARVVTSSGDLTTEGQSFVSGAAEREIDASGDLTTEGRSNVVGLSERIITATGNVQGNDVYIENAKVIEDGRFVAQDATVVGVAERTAVQIGSADLKPTSNNVVSGVAERIAGSTAVVVKPTDNNLVTGTAKRVIVSVDASIQAGNSVTDAEVDVFRSTGRIPLIRSFTVRKSPTRTIISRKRIKRINVRVGYLSDADV